MSSDAARSAQETEFRFDSVMGTESDQDKVYFSHALPMALSAMEPLKDPDQSPKNHLLVVMGPAGSGKTFTSWGGSQTSTRKTDLDGVLPRILDSMFSQSKHHVFASSSNKKKCNFAVKMTLLLVNQNQTKPQECQIHDLMQSPVTSNFSIASAKLAISSLPGTTLASLGTLKKKKKSPNNQNNHEEIFIEQDSNTSDYKVVNVQTQLCYNEAQARETLQVAWKNRSKLSKKSKRYQPHVYVAIQPVLLERASGKTIRTGATVGILDMASYDNPAMGHLKQIRAHRGNETVIPSGNHGHSAVLHCLSTLQRNQDVLASQRRTSKASSRYDDGSTVDSHDDKMVGFTKRLSVKKVPFRQNKVTMLIQPLFGDSASTTFVTLVITAYTGHRDYSEKRSLMAEAASFSGGFPTMFVSTGLSATTSIACPAITTASTCHLKKSKTQARQSAAKVVPSVAAHGNFFVEPRKQAPQTVEILRTKPLAVAPGINNASSMRFSDLEDDSDEPLVPLPPPVAPSYMASMNSPEPSAPIEIYYAVTGPSLMPQSHGSISDFPDLQVRGNSTSSPVLGLNEMGRSSPVYLPNQQQSLVVDGDLRTIRAPLQPSSIQPEKSPKFSPMKTFNDMMYASKKKGKQVMGKLTYPLPPATNPSNICDENVASGLSLENDPLPPERDLLQVRNERLEKENEALRAALLENRRESIVSEKVTSPSPKSMHEPSHSHYRKESSSCNLVDSDLFAFMAQLHSNSNY
jgi:hypothetical protein